MGRQITYFFIQCVTIAILLVATNKVRSDDATPIPAEAGGIGGWFSANVKPLAARKGTLDPKLEAAEANPKTIKVRADGSGDFKTISEAIKSVPTGNTQRVIVDIGAGEYKEKVTIARGQNFITLLGASSAQPTLSFAGTAKQYGTVYSATLQVDADYFVASNLIVKNTAPKPDGKMVGAQAVAVRIGGDMAAFYKCRFIGFQDTLCDDRGRHFFKDCYIEGTVDFIFGSGRSLYLGTELNVIPDVGTVITAQAKHTKSEVSGFSFVHCKVGGTASGTYLGRAWMEMPEVIFAFSTMSAVVNPEGWSNNNHPDREANVIFGEYKCTGAGANPSGRAKFSKQLSDAEVKPFISLSYIQGSSWLLPPP